MAGAASAIKLGNNHRPAESRSGLAAFLRRERAAGADRYRLSRWRIWIYSFVLWTVFALLNAAGSCMYFLVAQGTMQNWKGPLLWSFTDCYIWALLTPLIYQLCRRYSFHLKSWSRAFAFHIPTGMFFACFGALLTAAVNFAFPYTRGHFDSPFRVEVIALFLANVTRYTLIVAVMQAVNYYGKYRERELQSSQLEGQLASAQLQALKMQLEPHFIFNVLNSIASLSRSDPGSSERMTLQLAELLRLSLRNIHVQKVPLQRELEFLECYLRIQQTRFCDRLSIHFEIEPEVLEAEVPHLILQPLVENAIRHGISPRLASGRVEVQARRRGSWLALQIVDDGVGLPPGHRERSSTGVGLRNTRARLRQLYGDNYEFTCENLPEGGCRVRIAVPYRAAEAGKGDAHVTTHADHG